MLDEDYYDGLNINDEYSIRKDVLTLLEELDKFDNRLKKFLGPNKFRIAATDTRRSCRIMRKMLKVISDKIQMTKQDYDNDYEDD